MWSAPFGSSDPGTLYQQLDATAPTVVLAENPYTFREAAARDLGDVFGLSDVATAALTANRQEAQAQCERIRRVVGDETFSVLDVTPNEARLFGASHDTTNEVSVSIRSYIPDGPTVRAHRSCRLLPGPGVGQLVGTEPSAVISLELLPELRADHLIVMVRDQGEATCEALRRNPLWAYVPAAQKDYIYVFIGLLSAAGPYSSLWVLERAADVITAGCPQ